MPVTTESKDDFQGIGSQYTKAIEALSINLPDSVCRCQDECVLSPGKLVPLRRTRTNASKAFSFSLPLPAWITTAPLHSLDFHPPSYNNLPVGSDTYLRHWYLRRKEMCQEGKASTGALLDEREDTVKIKFMM